MFYGCSEYPKCDRVYWDKPVAIPCPKCHAPFLLEKTTKKDGTMHVCANENCDYKMAVGKIDLSTNKADEISAIF
jgi:DNA topoisomerase-1